MNNSVREERVKKGMTQQELADLLNVSRQTVFSIENGRYVPSTILALKLANVFKSRVEDIFRLEKGD